MSVVTFVAKSSGSTQAVRQSSISSDTSSALASNPLDQLSSADIALEVARMAHLDEAVSVSNNADSINAKLATASASTNVVAKPQVVTTALKSRRDIQKYVAQAGDTVGSVAAKFGVTSNTISWSNNITVDVLPAGKELVISPVNGIVYTVKAGDTIDSLAAKYHANRDQIIAFNDAEVGGLFVGEQIVIPDGSVQASTVASTATYYGGFAWGASAVYGYNGYDYGWCTWYVANRRAAIGRPVPSNLGNAYSWYYVAASVGLPTGLVPQVGAVAVNQGGNHVSIVEAVNPDGSFWVSEMNSRGQVSMTDPTPAGGWGRIDYKLYTSVGNLKFIY